jgi:PAS domain S-box-containing protein
MLWASDELGNLVYVNKCWQQTLGRDSTADLGDRWLEHLHPADRAPVRDAYFTSIQTCQPFELTYRIRTATGDYRWLTNRGTPRHEGGVLAGFVGTCFEPVGPPAVSASFRAAELSYRSLAEAIPALVLTTSSDGDVEFCNSRLLDYCGTDILGLQQARWVDFIHPDDVSGGRETWLQRVAAVQPFSSEYRIRRADGAYRWHLTHTAPLKNSEGQSRGWVAASIDVDDRHRAEDDALKIAEELRRATAAKDEFLGLVSHEFRTPITTIYGNAQVLRRNAGHLDIETLWLSLGDIEQEALRLQQLIDNMFVLARIEVNGVVVTEPVLLSRIVDRVVRDHQVRWPAYTIVVNDDLGPEPVEGEELYIEHVLRNLLSNANKYGKPDTPILIFTEHDATRALVRVRSQGNAPPREELDQLFDAFYRAPTLAGRAAGAGIGLTVCKRLAEAMGGGVWVRPYDDGLEVGFSLPLETEA